MLGLVVSNPNITDDALKRLTGYGSGRLDLNTVRLGHTPEPFEEQVVLPTKYILFNNLWCGSRVKRHMRLPLPAKVWGDDLIVRGCPHI